MRLGLGIVSSEFKENSISLWKEEGEKDETNEDEFMRDLDNFRDRIWIQQKSLVFLFKMWALLERLLKSQSLGK